MIAIAISFLMIGCASVERQATPATPDRPKPGKGLVNFYRQKNLVGFAIGYDVRDNGTKIGGLPNGSYFVYDASPGRHTFSATTESTSKVTLNIEPSQTYYVRGALQMGAFVGRPKLTVVEPQEGSEAIKSLRRVAHSE